MANSDFDGTCSWGLGGSGKLIPPPNPMISTPPMTVSNRDCDLGDLVSLSGAVASVSEDVFKSERSCVEFAVALSSLLVAMAMFPKKVLVTFYAGEPRAWFLCNRQSAAREVWQQRDWYSIQSCKSSMNDDRLCCRRQNKVTNVVWSLLIEKQRTSRFWKNFVFGNDKIFVKTKSNKLTAKTSRPWHCHSEEYEAFSNPVKLKSGREPNLATFCAWKSLTDLRSSSLHSPRQQQE